MFLAVMPGFMPGIHVFFQPDVDGRAFASPKRLRPRRRDEPGHDEHIGGLSQQRADTATSSGYITPARHVRAFCV
ncbi:hypothetical protein JJB98_19225 [Bradyrhizobium diazoefficiens]|nr:hypothetical protein [Bradyrhizobium diazoefficiens]QQO21912.1 hypothetical protein JJB98_19225 [Bradyrhizobium diazoefficiens]